jgi:ABC-type glycerol-3-phosphate transport system substrate-binding protein
MVVDTDHKPMSEVVESFKQGRISRRDFIARLAAAGLGLAGINAVLAACNAAVTASAPAASAGAASAAASAGAASAAASAAGASAGASGAAVTGPWAADPKSLTGTVRLYKGPFIKEEADLQAKWIQAFTDSGRAPGVKVEFSQYDWPSAEQQLTASLANGDHDVYYIPEVFYGKYPTADGPVEDLEPWIKDPDWLTITKDYFKEPNYPTRPKPTAPGSILGAVIWNDGAQSCQFLNLDLFEKAGVTPDEMLKSYDSMTEAARKIRALGPDIWGIMMRENGAVNFGWFEWYGYLKRAGSDFLTSDFTKPAINVPEFADALQMIQDWHVKDMVMPPFGKYDWPGIRGQFTSGKCGIIQEESGLAAVLAGMNPPATFKWDIAKFPPGPKADVIFANAAQWVMSNKSPNKQAAWEVMKFWSIPYKPYYEPVKMLVLYENWKEQGWFADDPVRQKEMGLLPFGKGPILHKQLLQFKTICEPYFDDVYAGKMTPQDALAKATTDIERALATGS